MGPAAIAEFFLKILPFEKLPRRVRTALTLAAGGMLLYYVAGFVLTGANAMQVNIYHWVFLALCGAGGLGIGQLAWMMKGGGDTPAPAASPPIPSPAPSISQSTTGHQSPNVVGNTTIIYNAPSGPSPEEIKYRGQLAEEINASRHSLDKSRNRWYTASVEGRRTDAELYWRESETRMRESPAVLRKKVSPTAETEFRQIHPGEPVYPNLRNLSLLKSRPTRRICILRTDPLFGRSWSDGSESSLGH